MPLSEHLPAPAKKGPRCTVSAALDQLDRDDRHTLVAWLGDQTITARRIAAAVQSATSLQLRPNTVHRHRRQECGCSQ